MYDPWIRIPRVSSFYWTERHIHVHRSQNRTRRFRWSEEVRIRNSWYWVLRDLLKHHDGALSISIQIIELHLIIEHCIVSMAPQFSYYQAISSAHCLHLFRKLKSRMSNKSIYQHHWRGFGRGCRSMFANEGMLGSEKQLLTKYSSLCWSVCSRANFASQPWIFWRYITKSESGV